MASIAATVRSTTSLLRTGTECGGLCLADSSCTGFWWNNSTSTCQTLAAFNLAGDTTASAIDGYVDNTLNPVDGIWAPWSTWGTCSLLCNTGTQTRSRSCNAPNYAGLRICPTNGLPSDTQICNTNPCPVNAYWNGCSTPWYSGPTSFQKGDIFNTGYCNGFIMPDKAISTLRVYHTGADGWNGDYVRIFFDDNTYKTCFANPQIYIEIANVFRNSIQLDNDQWTDMPCY